MQITSLKVTLKRLETNLKIATNECLYMISKYYFFLGMVSQIAIVYPGKHTFSKQSCIIRLGMNNIFAFSSHRFHSFQHDISCICALNIHCSVILNLVLQQKYEIRSTKLASVCGFVYMMCFTCQIIIYKFSTSTFVPAVALFSYANLLVSSFHLLFQLKFCFMKKEYKF